MDPAKRKIERRAKNPRAPHIKGFQKKARQLSSHPNVDALLIFLPPNTSTKFIADLYHSLNPARRPDPNQERRRLSLKEELVELDKVIEKVKARVVFLESVAKQNAENLTDKGGDLTSSAPTDVGNAPADRC